MKSRTNKAGEKRVMVTESKVEEFRSVYLANARVNRCGRIVKERRREKHSTRMDRKVAAMAHA